MSQQPPGSPDSGKPGSPIRNQIPVASLADFCSRLNTRQVEGELDAIFRESPEFGRTLAQRLLPFLESPQTGPLTLIGAGGEVAVFFDSSSQQVIKLCGPPARCRCGWLIRREPGGMLTFTPGGTDKILDRLALFESLFSSGISIDCIGEADAFLVFRQPFILGRHPTVSELAGHMRSLGWAPHREPCLGETLEHLTWRKGPYLATDVRPENALVSESTGTIHPIDFIVAGKEIACLDFVQRAGTLPTAASSAAPTSSKASTTNPLPLRLPISASQIFSISAFTLDVPNGLSVEGKCHIFLRNLIPSPSHLASRNHLIPPTDLKETTASKNLLSPPVSGRIAPMINDTGDG